MALYRLSDLSSRKTFKILTMSLVFEHYISFHLLSSLTLSHVFFILFSELKLMDKLSLSFSLNFLLKEKKYILVIKRLN